MGTLFSVEEASSVRHFPENDIPDMNLPEETENKYVSISLDDFFWLLDNQAIAVVYFGFFHPPVY